MATLDRKAVAKELARKLASYKLTSAAIQKLADRLLIDGLELNRFDPCMYGICVDYNTKKIPRLDKILIDAQISHLEVFPYGIIGWDRFHVRVGFGVDELAGREATGGFR